MAKGKSTWKYNKLLTARRNYFSGLQQGPSVIQRAIAPPPISPDIAGLGGTVVPQTTTTATTSTNNSPNIFQSAGSDIKSFFKNPIQALGSPTMGMTSMLGSAVGAIGGVAGKLISNGLESKAGSVVSGVGDALGGVPIVGGFAKGIFNVAGGGINALIGSKLNQANINAANSDIARMNSATSNASNFDALANNMASTVGRTIHSKSFYGRDGVFANKADKVYKDLEEQAEIASHRQDLALIDNAEDLISNQLAGLEANYTAYGGPLNMGMGALEYDLATRYLRTKEAIAQGQNKTMTALPNTDMFAFGGELGTNGADFTNGMVFINNGGSHESNPYQGVPMGVDQEGTPNLVEEGETIFNDYVFSRRLMVPKTIRKKYKLGGKLNLTFADASKILAKESEERPNDPISIRGLQVLMSDLANAQEEVKAERQSNKYSSGGKVNKFDGNSTTTNQMNNYAWNPFFQSLSGYTSSRIPGNTAGKYRPDTYLPMEGNPYMLGYKDIRELENDNAYQAFTEAMIANPNMDYLRALDAGVAKGVQTLFDGDKLRSNWADLFRKRRSDGIGGIYHWTPTMEAVQQAVQQSDSSSTPEVSPAPETPTTKVRGKKFLYKGDDGKYVEYTGENAPLYMKNNGYFSAGNDSDDDFDYYYYDPKEEIKQGKYADWLRYAPAVGFGIGTLTDALGITNKPDYSNADAILEATRGSGTYQPVGFNPIGNYLGYRPFDREFYINQMNAQSGATRRAIMQNAGMNRGAGMAALLAADNNAQNQIGLLGRQAEEYNLAQRQKVEDFNRATNMTNSQGFLQADIANQKAQAEMRDFNLKGTMAAIQMRDAERMRTDANKSANLSGLFQTLGDIGFEERNARMRDWAIEHGVFAPGTRDYGRFKTTKSKGGKIKRRKGLTF